MRSVNCRSTSLSDAVSTAAPTRTKPTIQPPANASTSNTQTAMIPNVRRISPMTPPLREADPVEESVYYAQRGWGVTREQGRRMRRPSARNGSAGSLLLLSAGERDLNPLAVLDRDAFEARRPICPVPGGGQQQAVVERFSTFEHRRGFDRTIHVDHDFDDAGAI